MHSCAHAAIMMFHSRSKTFCCTQYDQRSLLESTYDITNLKASETKIGLLNASVMRMGRSRAVED